jgi:hypothetical protein
MRNFAAVLAAFLACACSADEPTVEGSGPIDEMVPDLTPEEGFTYYVAPFDVPAGAEIQDCYFFAVPDLDNGQDVWIDRFVIAQRTGSHHMNVFRVKTILELGGQPGDIVRGGPCRESVNWADWPLVANSQESSADGPAVDWVLPTGVAQRFKPGELLMLQTHYVNATRQVTPGGGEVKVAFYRSKLADPIEMGTLFATQQSIRICQSAPKVSYDGTCSFPNATEPVHIAAANGHFHARGTRFKIYTWDGRSLDKPPEEQLCYESTSWDDPPMTTGMDEVVQPGGGIFWSCEYEWTPPGEGCDVVNARDHQGAGDCCYVFGNSAESAEHCNVFLYYWPKIDNTDIFCN